MKKVLLDKIGSVTLTCRLSREVRLGTEIPAVEGGVVAVRVLNSKSTYNQLELPSGRFSKVKPGDVVAGVLGHRKALFGYSGFLPPEVKVGDHLNLLNMGGVLGQCDGVNPDLGQPFDCEVLGQVLHFPYLGERVGIPSHIGQGAIPIGGALALQGVPVGRVPVVNFHFVFPPGLDLEFHAARPFLWGVTRNHASNAARHDRLISSSTSSGASRA